MNKTSAILTEQEFRDAMSKQCGFPVKTLRERIIERSAEITRSAGHSLDIRGQQFPNPLQLEETTQPEERVFDGEDAEEWQRRSEEQGTE